MWILKEYLSKNNIYSYVETRISFIDNNSINLHGSNGEAHFNIVLKGERYDGLVELQLEKKAEQWKILSANLEILPNKELIPLTP